MFWFHCLKLNTDELFAGYSELLIMMVYFISTSQNDVFEMVLSTITKFKLKKDHIPKPTLGVESPWGNPLVAYSLNPPLPSSLMCAHMYTSADKENETGNTSS